MSMQSKFPDHKCKKCGIMIKEGDTIVKVAAGHFCKNENCPGPVKSTHDDQAQSTIEEPPTEESAFAVVNFTRQEVKKLQHIETEVSNILGKVPDAKIGMYVKEIYRQQKLRENLP